MATEQVPAQKYPHHSQDDPTSTQRLRRRRRSHRQIFDETAPTSRPTNVRVAEIRATHTFEGPPPLLLKFFHEYTTSDAARALFAKVSNLGNMTYQQCLEEGGCPFRYFLYQCGMPKAVAMGIDLASIGPAGVSPQPTERDLNDQVARLYAYKSTPFTHVCKRMESLDVGYHLEQLPTEQLPHTHTVTFLQQSVPCDEQTPGPPYRDEHGLLYCHEDLQMPPNVVP